MIEQLFFNGPTWDGDVVSKSGRGELCKLGYAEHAWGFAYLTSKGVKFAIKSMAMDRAKEKWQRDRYEVRKIDVAD